MKSIRHAVRTPLCAVAIATIGCYQYRPRSLAEVVPAPQPIRIQLTDEGRVGVKALAGPGIDRIEGVLDSVNENSIVLRVSSVHRDTGDEMWTGERLPIARTDIASVSVRQFAPLQTAALVGGAIVAGLSLHFGVADPILGGKRSGSGSGSSR